MIKIKNNELVEMLIGEVKDFPRYTTQIMNLANQNAQGTRPRVVGQLSELIRECPEKTYEGWKKWYLTRHSTAIRDASRRIEDMVGKLRDAISHIDKSMIEKWVEDLILEKTFIGLKFQEAILQKIAEECGLKYRLAKPDEESQGIDGCIGGLPVSIKPTTYGIKAALPEEVKIPIIFYKKTKTGLEIYPDHFLSAVTHQ